MVFAENKIEPMLKLRSYVNLNKLGMFFYYLGGYHLGGVVIPMSTLARGPLVGKTCPAFQDTKRVCIMGNSEAKTHKNYIAKC